MTASIFKRAATAISEFIHGTPYERAVQRLMDAEEKARNRGENPDKSSECRRLEQEIARLERQRGIHP